MAHILRPLPIYTVWVRHADGALRAVCECHAPNARDALNIYRETDHSERGPFVVLPALTAAPLCVN